VCLQAWEEDLTRPCAADGWHHNAPYLRHIGGYRQVHRIYPQAGAPSKARLCQLGEDPSPGSPGQAPGTACCVAVGNGRGEAYTGR
jgi:hypothetical protein